MELEYICLLNDELYTAARIATYATCTCVLMPIYAVTMYMFGRFTPSLLLLFVFMFSCWVYDEYNGVPRYGPRVGNRQLAMDTHDYTIWRFIVPYGIIYGLLHGLLCFIYYTMCTIYAKYIT